MNTQHLKYAIEVEKTCSITQAAENLYMGQPSLSKLIKELEDSLGYTIFERTSKGVTPTQKGIEFLSYAKTIVLQVEKMESLSVPVDEDRQSFNISIPRGSYIADAVTNFVSELDESKGIDVNVQETNSIQVINNIIEGSFNLGIIRYQLEYENCFYDYLTEKHLRHEPLWEFEVLALMSEHHPLAHKDRVDFEELRDYTEIAHGDKVIPCIIQGNCMKTNITEKSPKCIYVYERCSQYDLLSSIPTTYMWVSPIPDKWLKKYNLVQRKCKASGHRYKDVLICPKEYEFTALDIKFLDKLSEAKNKVSFKDYK